MNIVLLYGGMSSEHEISCRSARTFDEAIDRGRHTVYRIFITKKGRWKLVDSIRDYTDEELADVPSAVIVPSREKEKLWILEEPLRKVRVDAAIPVLHGLMGEDGTIQGVLEMAGLPYVGDGVLASAVAMDKLTTKRLVAPLGIRQAKYVGVYREELTGDGLDAAVKRIEEALPYPVFVKPSNAGSSVGVSRAGSREQLVPALMLASEHDRKILVEEEIVGREVECAVLGGWDVKASRVGEILAADAFYTYDAKYSNPDSKTEIASCLPQEEEIRRDAVAIFKAIDGYGLSRVDFFVEEGTGEVVFNEINTMPGFTSISMYPALCADMGLDAKDLVERLLELALER